MATFVQRARAILAGMLNKAPADITDAEILRAARSLAPRPLLSRFDEMTDAQKVEYYVTRIFQVQRAALRAMDGNAAAVTARQQAQAGTDAGFTPQA
jgi:hypothetical protein